MKTFIFKVKHDSNKRGYNRTITVYRVKNNQPIYVGCDDEISTASYKGDHAVACQIISDELGHKLCQGNNWRGAGYDLASKNIKVIEV